MKTNKTAIFKNAWAIARTASTKFNDKVKVFFPASLKQAWREITMDKKITLKSAGKYPNLSISGLPEEFKKYSVELISYINLPYDHKKECFCTEITIEKITMMVEKIEAKKTEEAESQRRNEAIAKAKEINRDAPSRSLVNAGTVKVGDTLDGYIVTGLGRQFSSNEDYRSIGLGCYSEIQYAYFNYLNNNTILCWQIARRRVY